MERGELLDLAGRVLRLPTAPYHEHAVRDFVIGYCRELGVGVETDRVGNLIVKYQRRQLGKHASSETQAGTPVPLGPTKRIPKSALVVSVEMSKERPWARIGDGPIVRVGDRASIFDPGASASLWQTAEQCRAVDSTFRAQRCLMDGGTCEATAFVGFGYRAGGLCLPLGNYHNIGPHRRPRAEYVSVNDLEQLVKLTVAAAAEWRGAGPTNAMLRRRVASIMREAPRKLIKI